jgi:hypothetical protein
MTNSGAATHANPDKYQAGFGGTSVNLVLTGRGDFKARLTWVQLRYVNLLQVHENLGRIAYERQNNTKTSWSGSRKR